MRPTCQKVQTLLRGTILVPGKRAVTAALRVMGLEQVGNFGKYHRVLNQRAIGQGYRQPYVEKNAEHAIGCLFALFPAFAGGIAGGIIRGMVNAARRS